MLTVGLTGGLACGKSFVGKKLAGNSQAVRRQEARLARRDAACLNTPKRPLGETPQARKRLFLQARSAREACPT